MKNKKLLIFVSGVIILFCIEIYFAYKINKPLENYPTITIHDTIYREHSDWELLKTAIIWQESKGNSEAIGGNGYGLYQITPIYVKECNRILGYNKYTLHDRRNPLKSHEMFLVVQNYHNPEKDVKKAVKLHNKAGWYFEEVMDRYNCVKLYQEILTFKNK